MAIFHRCRPIFFLLSLLSLTLCGCRRDTPPPATTPQSVQATRQVDGVDIPFLPTATEQLLFARSNLNDPKVKSAAFKAVAVFYPNASHEQKLAALELAYLQLGEDYRIADSEQCRQALASYQKVFETYRDEPDIAAKALWYQGWIVSSLLAQPAAGEEYFRQLIHDYPGATVEFQSPPPWLKLEEVAPDESQRAQASSAAHWADLARIELVRNTRDDRQAASITRQMLETAADNPLAGLLVKNLLLFHAGSQEARDIATAYLGHNKDQAPAPANILADIRMAVATAAAADHAKRTTP